MRDARPAFNWAALRTIPIPDVLLALGGQKERASGERNPVFRFPDGLKVAVSTDKAGVFHLLNRPAAPVPQRGAVNLLVHLGVAATPQEAAEWLAVRFGDPISCLPPARPVRAGEEPSVLALPPRSSDAISKTLARAYLCEGRGLAWPVVASTIDRGILYADRWGYAVFLFRDARGAVVGATKRWARPEPPPRSRSGEPMPAKCAVRGSRLGHGWFPAWEAPSADTLILTESPIDAIAVATLLLRARRDLTRYTIRGLAGAAGWAAPGLLLPGIPRVVVAADADDMGAAYVDHARQHAPPGVDVLDGRPPARLHVKDWAEYCERRSAKKN